MDNWSRNGLIVSALASPVKLASKRGCSFCSYRLLKGFISYGNLFDCLLRLVVLKRPGSQSQKYGMLISGVTRGLSHGGQRLAERSPLVTVGGPTSQNS